MQIQKHAIDLGNDSVGKLVVRLAVPAVIAQLINLLYNLVDRMYVGAIKDIGMEALAGLGVVFPITLIVSAFASLVGLGGAPLAGIFLGEKRRDKANGVFNAGVVMLAFFSVVLTALVLIFCEPLVRLFGAPANVSGYARDYLFVYGAGTVFVMASLGLNPFITTQGYSLTSMLTVTIGAGLNIALDPLFIFVFGLGVRGAALATILSQAVSAVWVILFFSGKRSLFRFDFRLFRPKSAVMLKILLLGLPINLFLTVSLAYGTSRKSYPGKRLILGAILFTMLFNGGILPLYLQMRELHLTNTIWSVVLASGINVFYFVLARNYFCSLPEALIESAQLDGAGEWRILFSIILPISKPILATITLFYMVDRWNEWYNALIFIHDNSIIPLQVALRSIVMESNISSNTSSAQAAVRNFDMGIKMGAVMLTSLPIMCVFPFLQKHFAKGVMVGAIKA